MLELPVRKELFWDVDYASLNEDIHKLFIIQQVLNLGTIEEFRSVLDYYGFDGVRDALQNVGYLDPKTLSFVIWYFQLNKNELKCYSRRQSNPQHWI
jgi:hypothetical protein